jgi:hypothetical protein
MSTAIITVQLLLRILANEVVHHVPWPNLSLGTRYYNNRVCFTFQRHKIPISQDFLRLTQVSNNLRILIYILHACVAMSTDY